MSGISIATIKDPEFINLQPLDINPLVSSCEIKVLYVGKNRNRSYISKEVATEMSKTLRGSPIVGYFREDKDDFRDHGNELILNDDGVKFNVKTKPYGFVAPDAKVWFKEFEDTDDFGNKVTREYLMTTGYLWTEQFEESKRVIEEGRPHSMELDGNTLDGKWSEDSKSGIEFFIINDAIFSKLCILGKDVEPCFEGSSITALDISKEFSKTEENNFDYKTLYQMMEQLEYALKGGKEVTNIENQDPELTTQEEYARGSEEEKKEEKDKKKEEEQSKENSESKKEDKKEEEDKKTDHTLEKEYSLLEEKYKALEEKCDELLKFKKSIDEQKKQELIKSFYMLSDEDKKDVVENIDKYSYDDIESKLSVICVRKKVNFDLEEDAQREEEKKEDPTVTFNLEDQGESIPAWVKSIQNTKRNREK
ncbi:MAG: hypothetical protein [Caudoviricetes sp.]|nr:MAG: hypothetical protein [Caudoviricetes sp.]